MEAASWPRHCARLLGRMRRATPAGQLITVTIMPRASLSRRICTPKQQQPSQLLRLSDSLTGGQ